MPSEPAIIDTPSSNVYVNALHWEGWCWYDGGGATNITYYFGGGGTDLTNPFGNDVSDSVAWFGYEKAAYRNALQQWANVANITFTEVSSYGQADLVEYLTEDAGGALGIHETPQFAFLSDGTAWGVYDVNGVGFTESGLQRGGCGFVTLVHEIGHALGLSHPHDGGGDGIGVFPGVTPGAAFDDLGDNDLNQSIFTIMSYNDGWSGLGAFTSYDYGWASGPMAFDIAAIQYLYGTNTTYHSGDDTYTLGAGNTTLSCIWDNGGTDTIAYNGIYDCTIDLRDATLTNSVGGGGYVSYVDGAPANHLDHWSAFTIAYGVVIENAIGGSANDAFYLSSEVVNNVVDGNGGAEDTVYLPYAAMGGGWYVTAGSTANNLTIVGSAGSDVLRDIEFVHFEAGGIFPNGYTFTTEELTRVYTHFNAGSVSISDVAITEGNSGTKLATFTVTRTGGTQAFDVHFATADGTATVANGDYVAKSGTLHFGENVNTQTISVEIKGDGNLEFDETFAVNLSAATNGVTIGDNAGTATITNDDFVALPEIEVRGNGISIADGDTTPSVADLTDFGIVAQATHRMIPRAGCGCAACRNATDGEEKLAAAAPSDLGDVTQGTIVIHTFTVANTGGNLLTTSGLKLPKGFILVEGLSSSIAAGASDTFQVMMDTSTLGTKAGQISFKTNDLDEKAFNFSVSGTVNPMQALGSDRDDVFRATEYAEAFVGQAGSDTVTYAEAHAGVIASLLSPARNTGFAASDTYSSIENLTGSAFNDRLTGDAGNNVLEGGAGADALDGGTGFDTASYAGATAGVTVDLTNPKNNTGDAAGDTFKSIEKLVGSNHADRLTGGKLADVIEGFDGDDEIAGGAGLDILMGGKGADRFKFANLKDGGDTILDFVSGEDLVVISKTGFGLDADVAFGTKDASDFALHYFVSNATGAATEAGHGQFVFNRTTDELFWDADGAGAGVATLLARFKGDINLSATDFDLV